MKLRLFILLITSSLSACVALTAATIGAVVYYKNQHHEVATVNIQADAQKIYAFTLSQIEKNSAIELVEKDDEDLMVVITQGDIASSIKLSSLKGGLTQLMITSDTSADESEKRVLDALFKICDEFKVRCTLQEN
ncbi:MAG: DUF3568 domain-containing protein [Pseudomonadales bacterium]|nr:DUF3568 domain-containing protein [Pseudomonadales bacterium]